MKLTSYNDYIREYLVDKMDDLHERYEDILEAAMCLVNSLYQTFDDDPKSKEIISGILFTDLFKVVMFLQKHGLNEDEYLYYSYLIHNELDSPEDVMAQISADPSLLADMLINTYTLYYKDPLFKKVLHKSLSNKEVELLTKLAPRCITDSIINFKPFTVEEVVDSFIIDNDDELEIVDDPYRETSIKYIAGLLRELYLCDGSIDLIKEIIEQDQLACRYLTEYLPDAKLIDRLHEYNVSNKNNLYKKILFDQDILSDALKMLIHVYVDRSYKGITINKHILKNQSRNK